MPIFKAQLLLLVLACLAAASRWLGLAGGASSSAALGSSPALIDPRGDYVLRSDPVITLAPTPDLVIGDGALLTLGYDGSKGVGLGFQLFYIRDDGTVEALHLASFDDKGGGKFARNIVVFDSDADGRPGFMELSTMFTPPGTQPSEAIAKSKFVSLGMYPVRYRLKK
jgi:hypothetical protein